MPKRADLRSVLVIGSGPIIIGQACEFDYSGTQACRVLRAEGIRVSLVNSNPATIMTDPEFADATYVEPITPDVLAKVIAKERPDAILPTLGGQTALNAAVALHDNGTLAKYDVELIGASIEAIRAGEDRSQFKEIVTSVGADVPRSRICHTLDEARAAAAGLGFPVIVRPSFTLGGTGSGVARGAAELDRIAAAGLDASPVHWPGTVWSSSGPASTRSGRGRTAAPSSGSSRAWARRCPPAGCATPWPSASRPRPNSASPW